MDNNIYLEKLHMSEIKILDEIDRVCKENMLQYFLIGGTLLGTVRHSGFIPWDDDLDIAMPRKDYETFLKIANEQLSKNFFLDYNKNNKKYLNVFSKVRLKNTVYEENTLKNYNTNKELWVDIFPLDSTSNGFFIKIQWCIIRNLKKIMKFKLLSEKDSKLKNTIKKIVGFIFNSNFTIKLCTFFMKLSNNEKNKYFVNFGSQYGIKKQTHLKNKYLPAKELEFEGRMYKVPNDYDYVLRKIYGDNYMKLPPVEKRVTHNPIKVMFEDGQVIEFDKEK